MIRVLFPAGTTCARLLLLIGLMVVLNGCVLTKLVTTPLRIGGAIISVVPVVGNPTDKAIDEVADWIDDIPI